MMTDFMHRLTWAIDNYDTVLVTSNLYEQKLYTDFKYNWTTRALEWETLLRSMKDELSS